MKSSDPHAILDEILKMRSAEQVATTLKDAFKAESAPDSVLTIIANAGVHVVPETYLRGEIYEASRGDWNVSSEESLALELKGILARLVGKLRSGRWDRIYLIPTGHPILSLQIKIMVYRLLRINTIDLYYKAGSYFEVNIDQRALALETAEGG